jgi:hypothetical protein
MDHKNLLANLLRTMRQSSADQLCSELWEIFEAMQETEEEPETAPDFIQDEFMAVYCDR